MKIREREKQISDLVTSAFNILWPDASDYRKPENEAEHWAYLRLWDEFTTIVLRK